MKNKWLLLLFVGFFIAGIIGSAPFASAQPIVVSITPTPGQCSVPITDNIGNPVITPVIVKFSDAMDLPSLIAGFKISPVVTGNPSLDATGTILTFTPDAALESGKTYAVTITTAAASAAGIHMAASFKSAFSADSCPYIISTFPANNATNIGPNIQPSATFSTAMNGSTVNNRFTINTPFGGGVEGAASFNATTKTATFAPSGLLAPNTVYTATIRAGAQDKNGTLVISDYSWKFTTVAQGFNEVSGSEVPAPDSRNISQNTTVAATFTQPLNRSSIATTSFTLTDPLGTEVLLGTPTFSNGDKTVMFSHLSLQAGTTYLVTVTTEVTSATTPPLPLAAPVQWSFTTVPQFDVVQSSEVPTPDSTGVSTYPSISVNFTQAVLKRSITSTSFALTDPAGTMVSLGTPAFSNGDTTVSFGPLVGALKTNTIYKVKLTTAVSSAADPSSPLPAQTEWSFTTGAGGVPPFNVDVTTEVPSPKSINVPLNTTVSVSFTQPVAKSSIMSSSFTLTNTATGITVPLGTPEFSAGDMTVTFGPLSLETETNYAVMITPDVTSAAAQPAPLPAQVLWSFTTDAPPAPSPSASSGGVKCFIATAAYGSYLDPHVRALRTFRDKYLLTNAAGRALVEFYYRHSPPIAAFIAKHKDLRLATRLALTPVVYVVEYPFGFVIVFLGMAVVISRKKRHSRGDSAEPEIPTDSVDRS